MGRRQTDRDSKLYTPSPLNVYDVRADIERTWNLRVWIEVMAQPHEMLVIAKATEPELGPGKTVIAQALHTRRHGDYRPLEQFLYAALMDLHQQLDNPLGEFQRAQRGGS